MLAGTVGACGTAARPRTYQEFVNTKPPQLSGHIVLLGMPSDLVDFVAPLRSRHLAVVKPIVVVSPQEPSERSYVRWCGAQRRWHRESPVDPTSALVAAGTAESRACRKCTTYVVLHLCTAA